LKSLNRFFGECYFKVGRSTAKAEFINGEWIIHTYEHTSSNMDPIGPYAHAAVMQAAMEYIKRQRDTKP
jgi:hypothetical protein